jgi:hypothetical protein
MSIHIQVPSWRYDPVEQSQNESDRTGFDPAHPNSLEHFLIIEERIPVMRFLRFKPYLCLGIL